MRRPTLAAPSGGEQPRRLLFFVNNPAFLISHRLPLALAARDAGMEVHVATPDGPAVAEILAHGLHHHVVPLSRSGTNPWAEARSLFVFWRLLRRVRPDLVHAVTIKAVLYGGIACRLARVPAYVAAVSGLGYVFMRRPGRGFDPLRQGALWLYRLALGHRNSRVIFQNAADRDLLVEAGAVRPGRAVMIRGSGVDLEHYAPQPLPPGPVTVVMASRLLRDKGVVEFVGAAGLAAARNADLRWVLAGSPDPGNPASVTRDELDAWARAGTVEYVGECADVAALYAAAHLVALPSYREGLPKSLVEAAACGRPVVTTDVPGCRDAIDPGVSGVLVPPRDAQALADAVIALAADEAARLRMGAAGRALAERDFGIQSIVQAHLDIYRTLLDD
uniref:glycosyltransferase family 4 protein n=1 Tax=Castellaniella defragrans TaxID=75697 RepID=UPI0033421F27